MRNLALVPRAPWTRAGVRQIATPSGARRLSTLSHIDYEDAFLVRPAPAEQRTCEQYARAILDDAPITTRSALLAGWSSLGLRLTPTRSDGYVLGWKVLTSTPDFALLAADSPLGLHGQLLLKRHRHNLLFCTFLKLDNAIVRGVWAGVEPVHRQVVPRVLAQANLRERHQG